MDSYLNKILLEIRELRKHIKREDLYKCKKSCDVLESYLKLLVKENTKKIE